MATDHNFRIKNGLTIGSTEVIDSNGKLTAAAFGTDSIDKVHDEVDSLMTAGTGISLAYDDSAGTLTITNTYDNTDVQSYLTAQGIETGATADQTASEILTLLKTVDSNTSGLNADTLDGQQGSYYYAASNPNGYTNDQTAAEILTLLKTVDTNTSGLNADTIDGLHSSDIVETSNGNTGSLDTFYSAGMFGWATTTTGRPENYGQGISIVNDGKTHNNTNNWITQLAFGTSNTTAYFRGKTNSGSWGSWHTLWHSNNLTTTNKSNYDTAYGWGDHSTQSYATQTYVGNQISALVDSSPAALNTLNELAAAIGDDANFSTTITNSIGTKWTQNNTKISQWDTAYGWGNHASAGYTSNVGDITGVTAGTGMTGGGTTGTPTLNVIGGDGITANADNITVDSTVFRNNSAQYLQFNTTTGETLTFKNSTSAGKIQVGFQQNDTDGMHHRAYLKAWKGSATASGNVDLIVRGSGGSLTSDVLSFRSGNASPTWRGQAIWNAGNLTNNSTNWNTAYGWGNHASAGYTSNVGDITAVTAGTGLTGGATSGAATLNVIGGDGITANADDIAVDSTVVRTSGTQLIGGNKSWTGTLYMADKQIGRAHV
jgi:hypothetical protein